MKGDGVREQETLGNYAKGFYFELAGNESPLKWGSGGSINSSSISYS